MTTFVHLANTDVEFEFAHLTNLSIKRAWSLNPVCLQLQYLPLLYANADDLVAVTEYPDEAYLNGLMKTGWWPEGLPCMTLLDGSDAINDLQCLSWGPSLQVQAWAAERGAYYAMPPDWPTVCFVNSKAFSFRFKSIPGVSLLRNEQELRRWLEETKGQKVLKTCYGLSGMGNKRTDHSDATPDVLAFCRKEWVQQRPIIGEPWLDRILDFSTQWKIHPDKRVECLGTTTFETNAHGTYQGTLAGPESILFDSYEVYLHQHKKYVQNALEKVLDLGFFGSIGFDAFLYRHPEDASIHLNALVEINGRQTMSLIALLLQKRVCPDQVLKFSFQKSKQVSPSLLPDHCTNEQGKRIIFHRCLTACVIS